MLVPLASVDLPLMDYDIIKGGLIFPFSGCFQIVGRPFDPKLLLSVVLTVPARRAALRADFT